MLKKKILFLLLIVMLVIIFSFIIGQSLINNVIKNEKIKEVSNNENITTYKEERKLLNIEKNNMVSEFFPNDITEITLINYLSDSSNPTTYTINDEEKMKNFIELFTNSTWNEDNSKYDRTTYWKITIKGSTNTIFNMLGIGGNNSNFGFVQVINDNCNKIYQISKTTYLEILSFTNEKYYLHESNLEIPNQKKCYEAQKEAFIGLDKDTVDNVKKEIRQIHSSLEFTLLDAVRILKDSNSPYWIRFIESGTYEEPLDSSTKVESNGILTVYLNNTEKLLNKIQNNKVKEDLNIAHSYLQNGISQHSISNLFEAHKILHDYDYWIFNTPVHLDYEPADWTGVDTYFGKASILN